MKRILAAVLMGLFFAVGAQASEQVYFHSMTEDTSANRILSPGDTYTVPLNDESHTVVDWKVWITSDTQTNFVHYTTAPSATRADTTNARISPSHLYHNEDTHDTTMRLFAPHTNTGGVRINYRIQKNVSGIN